MRPAEFRGLKESRRRQRTPQEADAAYRSSAAWYALPLDVLPWWPRRTGFTSEHGSRTRETTGANDNEPAGPARERSGAPAPTSKGLDNAHQEFADDQHRIGLAHTSRHSSLPGRRAQYARKHGETNGLGSDAQRFAKVDGVVPIKTKKRMFIDAQRTVIARHRRLPGIGLRPGGWLPHPVSAGSGSGPAWRS